MKKNIRNKYFVLSIACWGFIASSGARAETFTFPEVWKMIQEHSAAQEGAQLKIESAEAGWERARNHWLPKIYLEGRSYRTNDPGSSFFGILEQRKVENSDFTPESLNHPDSQTFHRGALGLDWSLYEGGSKMAQKEMTQRIVESEKYFSSQVRVEQYAGAGLAYGSMASHRRHIGKLVALEKEIAQMMKSYQIGQKSNPVGYSGLLGMKSLSQRISGMREQLQAQEKSSAAMLRALGMKASNWNPENRETQKFLDQVFAAAPNSAPAPSFKVASQNALAEAAVEGAQMERARVRPRVGAFAETSLFKGSRGQAAEYMAGLYLQWSLYDASESGKFREAQLAAGAARKLTEAQALQESAEREALEESEKALRANLRRLTESEELLGEQVQVSSQLFRNGSINALQFVEILNRRTDLIFQQSETESSLLKVSSERIQKTPFSIPELDREKQTEAKNEKN